MHEKIGAVVFKAGVGLLGAAVATNDVPLLYAQLDPHIIFWSRLCGLVLCICSIVAVALTIRKRLRQDATDSGIDREDE